MSLLKRIPATAIVVLAVLVMFAIELFVAFQGAPQGMKALQDGGADPTALMRCGAMFPAMPLKKDAWRLVAAIFIHVGWAHLFFNVLALFQLGYVLESLFGSRIFCVSFFISGVFASFASLFYMRIVHENADTLSAGASGAIFGILATLAVLLKRSPQLRKRSWSKKMSSQMFGCAAFNLALGLAWSGWVRVFGGSIDIDNAAHVGGLITGFLIGCLRVPAVIESTLIDRFDEQDRFREAQRRLIDEQDWD